MDSDDAFARGVPACPQHALPFMRRSSGNRWWIWSEPAVADTALTAPERDELARLRRENEQL